jgi:hypothetical protein
MVDKEITDTDFPSFCSVCGNKFNRSGVKFCPKCGSTVKRRIGEDTPQEEVITPKEPIHSSPIPQEAPQTTQMPAPQRHVPIMVPPTSQRDEFFTERHLRPFKGEFFNNDEYKTLGIIFLMAYLSHVFRIFLMFNRFPAFLELIYAIPIYLAIVAIVYSVQRKILFNKGFSHRVYITRFGSTVSLVLSTFFLTVLPHEIKPDYENSMMPPKINVLISNKQGSGYQELPRPAYVQNKLIPNSYLIVNFTVLIVGFIFLMAYVNIQDPYWKTTFRLASAFISVFLLTELAPIYGRHRTETIRAGKYRSYLVFLLGLILTVSALFGEKFLSAVPSAIGQ